ncbi:MAG: 30S ribosomal protein S14 [Gammaproteobacteria bacterium]|nr:30S ribosomal protein S14 [Gammaproteobacteria bacterium]
MATVRMKARERARLKKVAKCSAKREELRGVIKNAEVDYDEKMAAINSLNKMDPNGSYIRVRRICRVCGRPRGVFRKFGLCRMCIRKALMFGLVPGARKASW